MKAMYALMQFSGFGIVKPSQILILDIIFFLAESMYQPSLGLQPQKGTVSQIMQCRHFDC